MRDFIFIFYIYILYLRRIIRELKTQIYTNIIFISKTDYQRVKDSLLAGCMREFRVGLLVK